LKRLNALFSGCVDEYHTTAVSPGFTKGALRMLRAGPEMRPAFRACCGDFKGRNPFGEPISRDFRTNRSSWTTGSQKRASVGCRRRTRPWAAVHGPTLPRGRRKFVHSSQNSTSMTRTFWRASISYSQTLESRLPFGLNRPDQTLAADHIAPVPSC
jgi:hypothetical protein